MGSGLCTVAVHNGPCGMVAVVKFVRFTFIYLYYLLLHLYPLIYTGTYLFRSTDLPTSIFLPLYHLYPSTYLSTVRPFFVCVCDPDWA